MAERLVVIGGDAAGMSAATNARRGRPDLEIVTIERGVDTSFSACGIPYVVGGSVGAVDDLVVRTPQEFRDGHRIDVRLRHEVRAIDLDRRQLEVRALDHGRTIFLGFDQLMIATGARPRRPDLDGIDQNWIHGVQNLVDARRLLERMTLGYRDVVVVGGGYIGLEMAEAFVDRGARVTIVERGAHVLGAADPPIAARLRRALEGYGVTVRTGVSVSGFGDHVVHTSDGDLRADLAILGLGVTPNAELAGAAGIDLGAGGAIKVDFRQRTSADGVWSAGDCADVFHLVSKERAHIALGTVANKTGRVAGINIGGGYATFPGVLGTAVTRICAVEVAFTGLNTAAAARAGIEVVTGDVTSTSRAGYHPEHAEVDARILAERGTGRIIGAQIIGADRVGKRIDMMATAMSAGLTVERLPDLDLAYAPSVATVTDPWQVAARRAADQL